MLPVYQTPLVVKNRVGGGDSFLPSLDSGKKSNLTSDGMAYLRRQGINVDDENEPSP